MSRYDTAVLRSVAQLESLESEWRELAEPFATPLLDHDWFVCAARALHEESHLRVVTVRERGRLTAVAPLTVNRTNHLVLLGSSVLHEPSGWLYESPDALRELIDALLQMRQVIVLDRIPAGTINGALVRRRVGWQALTIRRQTAESFVVPTHLPWQTYCASLSSRTRKRLDEARAKAERDYGEVRFSRFAPSPDCALKALQQLVDVEARGWKGKQGTAISTRPELLRFFRLYAERAATRGRLRMSLLWIGADVAAVELGVEAYGRMWGLKIAYDERFAAYAPALQLIHESIGVASTAGLQAYEFLGSAESWQKRWRPQRRGYELAAIYPLSPRSLITAFQDATAHLSRRVQRMRHQEVEA